MKEPESRTQISLEDLLRLKRSERPPEDFWPEFDRQLRRKQLAALVDARPGWRAWLGGRMIARICMPLGATAALALAFSSVRTWNRNPASTPATPVAPMQEIAAAMDPESVTTVAEIAATASDTDSSESVGGVFAQPNSSGVSQDLVRVAATEPVGAPESSQPAVRSMAASVAAAIMADPSFTGLVDRMTTAMTPVMSQRPLVEPLTQIATPRDSRRARLMAYFVEADPHAPASSGAVHSRERITRRLSDDALYDSISRLGLTGESVSIKF